MGLGLGAGQILTCTRQGSFHDDPTPIQSALTLCSFSVRTVRFMMHSTLLGCKVYYVQYSTHDLLEQTGCSQREETCSWRIRQPRWSLISGP